MKTILIAGAALALVASLANADTTDPQGQWRTIDDETGEPRSVVALTVAEGELRGKVLKILNPTEPNPRCAECSGERKDQPIEGMTILWGLTQDDDQWEEGTVLDPESGKEYDANLKLIEGGKKLELRGYLGVSWLGRTQVWERMQ